MDRVACISNNCGSSKSNSTARNNDNNTSHGSFWVAPDNPSAIHLLTYTTFIIIIIIITIYNATIAANCQKSG